MGVTRVEAILNPFKSIYYKADDMRKKRAGFRKKPTCVVGNLERDMNKVVAQAFEA